MAEDARPNLAHSAEYLGEERDHWWEPDFMASLIRRWGLGGHRRILDVGCGVGHWGRVLLPHLSQDASLVGIDRETEWIARAQAAAIAKGIDRQARYMQGDARTLPFPDADFDLVTCQTVLIHVPDCRQVIIEMIRVLRPGGCLLVAEPNNLAATQIVGSTRFHEPVEQRLALTRFQLVCERGKESLGEGNNSIGELVPGLFIELGLQGVKVCQSSRAAPLLPPYQSAPEQSLRNQLLDWSTRDFWIWSKHDTRRFFLAGGGDPDEFGPLWSLAMKLVKQEAAELQKGTYHCAGGNVFYLVAGWKPQ